MRRRAVLAAIGVVLAAFGLWLSTQTFQINEGNQCTVDGGCRNVIANVPSVAIGAVLIVIGILAVVVGLRKSEDE